MSDVIPLRTNATIESQDDKPSEGASVQEIIQLDANGSDLDWQELESAFENNSSEISSYINLRTGEVRRIVAGLETKEDTLIRVGSVPDYLFIEPINSKDQYRWMEEFIETVEEKDLKSKLRASIDGKGAFRRFKDVLFSYPEQKDAWFNKRSYEIRLHILSWLKTHKIKPCFPPPWLNEDGSIQHTPIDGIMGKTRINGQNGQINPGEIRRLVHEAADTLSYRDLFHALSYLEFLRLHRLGHFSRSGSTRKSYPPPEPPPSEEP